MRMGVDASGLVDLIYQLDEEVDERYVLLAAGGTALTLQNVKASTADVDFVVQSGDLAKLGKACSRLASVRVDLFESGFVFNNRLPDSCTSRARQKLKLNNITLLVLDRIDVVMTKIARAEDGDIEDIRACKIVGTTSSDIYEMLTEYEMDTPEMRNNLRKVMREAFGIDTGNDEADLR